jgi:hypothetical protein
MKAEIIVSFEGMNRTELIGALQGLRDVEQKDPQRIQMFILVNSPEMTIEETKGVLAWLKPPLPYTSVITHEGLGSSIAGTTVHMKEEKSHAD